MNRRLALLVFILLPVLGTACPAAGQPRPKSTLVKGYTIEGERLEGTLGGAWEWSGKVKVTGETATATCDRLKVWLTPDGRDPARAEAEGNILIRGRYLSTDKIEWAIAAEAELASFDWKSGQGTLEGGVGFEARNLTTGAVVLLAADRLIYDAAARRFRFEGAEHPVRGQWQESAEEQPPDGGSGETEGGEASSEP